MKFLSTLPKLKQLLVGASATLASFTAASAQPTTIPKGLDLIEKVFCPFYKYGQGPLLVMVVAGCVVAGIISHKLGGNKVWGSILEILVLVGVAASVPLAISQAKGVNLVNCIS